MDPATKKKQESSSHSRLLYSSLCYLIVSTVLLLVLFNNDLVDGRIYRRSHKHLGVCRKEFLRPLEKRQLSAALVFTGTVERVYKAHSHPHHYRGIVRVKRVIKGLKQFQGNRVVVEGFGSQKICVSDVKEQDTRIFLTNPISHGRLKLNSSLIRVNRKNVRKAVAAAKQSVTLSKSQVANLRYLTNKLDRLSRSSSLSSFETNRL